MHDLISKLAPDDLEFKGQLALAFFENPFLVSGASELRVRFGRSTSELEPALSDLCTAGVLCCDDGRVRLDAQTCYAALAEWCAGLQGNDAALRQRVVEAVSLARLQDALAVSREEVSAILEIVPAGVLLLDGYGHLLKANAQGRRLLKLRDDADGGDMCKRLGLSLEEALDAPLYAEVEVPLPLSVTSRPFAKGRGDRGVVIAIQDISARREMEAEAARLREDFFSMLRHELRRPLLTVTRCLAQPEVNDECLELARQSSAHLGAMVDDMLLLAQLERDPMSVVPKEDVSLQFLIAGSDLAYRARAKEAGIAFEVALPDGDLHFCGDGARLTQVIGNLLDNAIKFTPAGGAVTLSAEKQQDAVCITVTDTGPGVPIAERDRIFGKFYQVQKGPGRQPGLGLGLAICQHIASAHNGVIAVGENHPEGTRVDVRIPLRETEENHASKAHHHR